MVQCLQNLLAKIPDYCFHFKVDFFFGEHISWILCRQQGVASARVDIDQDRELALQYGVTTFPRVLFWNR